MKSKIQKAAADVALRISKESRSVVQADIFDMVLDLNCDFYADEVEEIVMLVMGDDYAG